MTDEPRSRMRFVELLVAIMVIGVVAALVFPAIQAARSSARRIQRSDNLKNVGLALQNFEDTYRHYPPAVRRDDAGRPLSSWRYHILPFVAAFMVEVDYAKPWWDPEAKYFSTRPMDIYCFPESRGDMPCNTNVAGIVGASTVFDELQVNKASDFDDQTILAMEVLEFDRHWMEPGDLAFADVSDSLTGGIDGMGLLVVCVDGSVRHVNEATSAAELKKYMTAGDSEGRDPSLFTR